MRETNKELGPWRERVALEAYRALGEDPTMITGPIAVGLEFVLYRPTGAPKTKTPPATKKPDVDKLIRAILDACTHVLWTDDSQVTWVLATKRVAELGESPGVSVWVQLIENTVCSSP
jgi:crossover junction endodeoxyribonuclease RusA